MIKVNNEELLNTNILRARIAELEYGKTEKISDEVIRRIYIEETGKELPVEITVYRSDDIKQLQDYRSQGKDSGFDGTVIHFYNPERGINQSYTITRGSEHAEDNGEPLDWYYNGFGIFTGKVHNQYRDAEIFDDIVTMEINNKVSHDMKNHLSNGESIPQVDLRKYGIGHSLGGNLIQMLHLTNPAFESVYAINDAAPSAYQLALIDREFRFSIASHFNIDPNDDEQLYAIPPDQLKAFAEEYFKKSAGNIHHLTAEEDMLFGASGIRGFLDLGTREVINTDPDFEGLRTMLGNISDKDLRTLQMFLATVAPYYNEEGAKGLLKGMFGYDENIPVLIDNIQKEWNKFVFGPKWKFTGVDVNFDIFPLGSTNLKLPALVPNIPTELFSSVGKLRVHLLEMQGRLTALVGVIPSFIRILYATTGTLREDLVPHLEAIKGSAANILTAIGNLSKGAMEAVFKPDVPNMFNYLVDFINLAAIVKQEIANIKEELSNLWEGIKGWLGDLTKAVDAHGLNHVATALSDDNKRYEGNDMIISTGSHSQKVEVNLSSAVRIYQLGMDKYQDKKEVLNRLRNLYSQEYIHDFQQRTSRLMHSIHYMESNPRAFKYLLPSKNLEITGISVNEDIRPLDALLTDKFEEMFHDFDREIELGTKLINRIRSSIEQLFHEDQKISDIFDLANMKV